MTRLRLAAAERYCDPGMQIVRQFFTSNFVSQKARRGFNQKYPVSNEEVSKQ
jgi:hypothetical protein